MFYNLGILQFKVKLETIKGSLKIQKSTFKNRSQFKKFNKL